VSLLRWLTRNWADTDAGDDATLAPPELPVPPEAAVHRLRSAVLHLPRWRIEASDLQAGTLHAVRATRLFGFRDDIHVRLEPVAGGTRVHARSASRVGKGDFGQNRRNLLELFAALRKEPGG
jgi:uncharacterized protein (DUF1499 family)